MHIDPERVCFNRRENRFIELIHGHSIITWVLDRFPFSAVLVLERPIFRNVASAVDRLIGEPINADLRNFRFAGKIKLGPFRGAFVVLPGKARFAVIAGFCGNDAVVDGVNRVKMPTVRS